MKVIFHDDFYQVYTGDPAAASGRMEAVVQAIEDHVEFVPAEPALPEEIAAVHSDRHIQKVENQGLYPIAALAAGGGCTKCTDRSFRTLLWADSPARPSCFCRISLGILLFQQHGGGPGFPASTKNDSTGMCAGH